MTSDLPQPESPLWKESTRRGGVGAIRWIPISAALSDGLEIGIDSDGHWVYDTAEGVARVGDHGRYVHLLPALKIRRVEALKAISDALAAKSLSEDIANSFPFNAIIVEGLRARGYWSGLAIANLEQEGTLAPEFEAPLKELVTNIDQTTQKVRHAAQRLLHKLRTRNDNK